MTRSFTQLGPVVKGIYRGIALNQRQGLIAAMLQQGCRVIQRTGGTIITYQTRRRA